MKSTAELKNNADKTEESKQHQRDDSYVDGISAQHSVMNFDEPVKKSPDSSNSGFSIVSSRTCKVLTIATIIFILVIINLAINTAILREVQDDKTIVNTVVGSELDQPAGLPGFKDTTTWNQIETLAKSTTLNFYLYSPTGSSPRRWVDNVLTTELSEKFGITLNRIDAVYANCDLAAMKLVCDVQNEVNAGKTTEGGAVDLVWINGANFAKMKELDLLYGPWSTNVPNSKNFDFSNPSISFDKGVPIEGMELPFNLAQSIFLYNNRTVASPPTDVPSFIQWVKNNPGRFIYSDPLKDFTGAAFIRRLFYYYAGTGAGGSPNDLLGSFNENLYNQHAPTLWRILNEIEPMLYKPAGQTTPWYPTDHEAEIRPLMGSETIWMDFSFLISEASTRIIDSSWPSTIRGYVLSTGTIADSNYLAIPVNANNREAALIAANHIASAGSMFSRALPEIWGTLQAFDPTAPSIKEWDRKCQG
mmetsp:Transcript_31660/g.50842  ORF Transcript_31660/g.50842 Transcript_31660/m.50842 type:complete len:475 (-) Transcript_31660:164-1588(-)